MLRTFLAVLFVFSTSSHAILTHSVVSSINGQSGAITMDSDDAAEGSVNLYFTSARAKNACVADALSNGVTDLAASQNAVFDALALKQDAISSTVDVSAKSVAVVEGLKLNTTGAQPSCNSGNRGLMWQVQGALGVADLFQVCEKTALNAYLWVSH